MMSPVTTTDHPLLTCESLAHSLEEVSALWAEGAMLMLETLETRDTEEAGLGLGTWGRHRDTLTRCWSNLDMMSPLERDLKRK